MNKKTIESYNTICMEIDSIRKDIATLYRERESIRDTAKSYLTGYPKTIVIEGKVMDISLENKYNKLINALHMKLGDRIVLKEKIENFINKLPDEDRQILRMLIFEARCQSYIARKLNYSQSTVSKKINRIFKKE